MNLRYIFPKVLLLGVVLMLAGCGSGTEPPVVGEIQAQPPNTPIQVGETANLTIPVSGAELQFEWTVIRGTLTDPTRPAVIYTAPNTPGFDTVTVTVTNEGGTVIKSINFEVVAPPPTPTPTPTDTPIPTNTPTFTPIPGPIECRNPSITKNVFPWFLDVNGQFPFYGPVEEPRFSCEGVYDIFHSAPMAVHIEFDSFGSNYGYWGIGVLEGFGSFDVTGYNQVCFWAYAEKPDQAFRLKLRELGKPDQGIIVAIDAANQWKEICTELTKFSELGVNLNRLENVNLGFEADIGGVEVWVDDFEFRR